ncbi:hypothetical protein FB451DRAFT_1373933 [Mycena latifolia]|nr:hypothetical protein FB451DRAFT_1373933 [Mycena latifolia]
MYPGLTDSTDVQSARTRGSKPNRSNLSVGTFTPRWRIVQADGRVDPRTPSHIAHRIRFEGWRWNELSWSERASHSQVPGHLTTCQVRGTHAFSSPVFVRSTREISTSGMHWKSGICTYLVPTQSPTRFWGASRRVSTQAGLFLGSAFSGLPAVPNLTCVNVARGVRRELGVTGKVGRGARGTLGMRACVRDVGHQDGALGQRGAVYRPDSGERCSGRHGARRARRALPAVPGMHWSETRASRARTAHASEHPQPCPFDTVRKPGVTEEARRMRTAAPLREYSRTCACTPQSQPGAACGACCKSSRARNQGGFAAAPAGGRRHNYREPLAHSASRIRGRSCARGMWRVRSASRGAGGASRRGVHCAFGVGVGGPRCALAFDMSNERRKKRADDDTPCNRVAELVGGACSSSMLSEGLRGGKSRPTQWNLGADRSYRNGWARVQRLGAVACSSARSKSYAARRASASVPILKQVPNVKSMLDKSAGEVLPGPGKDAIHLGRLANDQRWHFSSAASAMHDMRLNFGTLVGLNEASRRVVSAQRNEISESTSLCSGTRARARARRAVPSVQNHGQHGPAPGDRVIRVHGARHAKLVPPKNARLQLLEEAKWYAQVKVFLPPAALWDRHRRCSVSRQLNMLNAKARVKTTALMQERRSGNPG